LFAIALVAAVWFFFAYLIVLFAIVFVVTLLAFTFGIVSIEVTHTDGTKKQYYVGDVIRLWR
jgi:hypothetical protein